MHGVLPSLTSIIILTYNQLDHTKKCLTSIEAYTMEQYELIIVDNGSTDGTREYLLEYMASHENVRVILNAYNRGFATGNNQGLILARGGYVLLLNNDTVVTEGWLGRMLAVFDRYPEVGIVGPVSNYVSGPQLVENVPYLTLEEMHHFAAEWTIKHEGQTKEINRIVAFCLLTRKAVIDRIGGLDEQFVGGNFEDDDFCYRAAMAGFKARIAQDVFIHHTGGQTFKGARIDWQQSMEQNWERFKTKWGISLDVPLGQGYSIPSQVPDISQYFIPLSSEGLLAYYKMDNNQRLYQDVTLSSRSPDVASSVTRKVQCKTNLKVPEPNVLSKNPKLSICMIVKDEEKNLKRCLKSVRSIVNELIVVDTGSKDNSISVAKNFGAKVSRFTWCDDFSAARNEALKHATGDWIFQIDADEELLPNSIPFLRERMQDAWSLLYMITIDNGPAHSERFYKSGRLFRNHPHILYSRPYHETIRPSVDNLITSESGWRIVYEPKIVIRHYGYEKSQIDNKGKWNRELRILELYIKENPDDQSMAIRLAELYEHAERYDEALDICKRALAINPNYAAAHHIMGTAFYSMGRLDEAIVAFKKCLAIDPQLAWVHYHLGAAYCNKGNIDDAVVELKQAIVIDPDLGKAHISLGVIYHMKGMLNEAFDEYQQALKINPADAEAHFNLGIMYRNKGMLDEAIKEYKKALANDPLLAEAHNNIAITYYLKKEYRKAVKHCDKAIALGFKVHPKFLQDLEPYRK